jgi:hypothetical protein
VAGVSICMLSKVPPGVESSIAAVARGDVMIPPDCDPALINDTSPSSFSSSRAVLERVGFRELRRRTVSAGRHSLFNRRHLTILIDIYTNAKWDAVF